MDINEKKELLKEFFDSVQNEDVKNFMEQCVEVIPNYWYEVPASSTGKYHPEYSQGNGGLMRHTIALLRFFDRFARNSTFTGEFTTKELDLLRVACLMHDSMKSGDDERFKKNKYTCFEHPILAANLVRSIETEHISDDEKEFIANAIEPHMGQWNTDPYGKSNISLPLPTTPAQKIIHLVDYLAAQKGVELDFDKPSANKEVVTENKAEVATVDNFVFKFGKHIGKSLKAVIAEDPRYISWCKENITSEPLRTILKQV